jgi:SAM-dependent methyltransferase
MAVHDVAQRGFDSGAGAYDRARPSYPPDAIDWLASNLRIQPGARICDLAAGTGKLTRLLAPFGADLFAVEPVEGMYRVLGESLPELPIVAGAAEALPLQDASIDAVTVAQAFHWFDADRAFGELARVLRPGGRAGLIWNARDRTVDWVDKVWGIMDREERNAPWRDHEHWRDSALGARNGFGELHEATFQHSQDITPEGVVERIASVSHIAALPEQRHTEVLDEIRHLLATHPDTTGREDLAIPYRVDAYWCERI